MIVSNTICPPYILVTAASLTVYAMSSDDVLADTVRYCGSFEHSTARPLNFAYSATHDGLLVVTLHVSHSVSQSLPLTYVVSYAIRTATLDGVSAVDTVSSSAVRTLALASVMVVPGDVATSTTLWVPANGSVASPINTAHTTFAIASTLHRHQHQQHHHGDNRTNHTQSNTNHMDPNATIVCPTLTRPDHTSAASHDT